MLLPGLLRPLLTSAYSSPPAGILLRSRPKTKNLGTMFVRFSDKRPDEGAYRIDNVVGGVFGQSDERDALPRGTASRIPRPQTPWDLPISGRARPPRIVGVTVAQKTKRTTPVHVGKTVVVVGLGRGAVPGDLRSGRGRGRETRALSPPPP